MRRLLLWAGSLLFSVFVGSEAQEALRVQRGSSGQIELSWPGRAMLSDGSERRPYFELDRSADLRRWEPVGERKRALEGADLLRLELEANDGLGFFRLREFEPRLSRLAEDSAGVFGYGKAFEQELARIGQISLGEFEQMFPVTNQFLEKLSWDPTSARFWTDFNANPVFRLNATELAMFKTNGFVVSERLGGREDTFVPEDDSFSDIFYRVWFADLPVFVTTDAILQAWHRTYDGMLAEVEETFLTSALETMLSALAEKVPEVWSEAGGSPLHESIRDADLFLAVARSLLSTNQVPSALGQDARVAEMLALVRSYQLIETELFGECRKIDFSQFRTRGHYMRTPRLQRYFQSSMWLGRTDFMVAGGMIERCDGDRRPVSPRETGGAVVMWDLLQRAGQFQRWRQVDRVIESFVGWSDSLGFAQLGGLLAGAGIRSVRDVANLDKLLELQQAVLAGDLGVQNIRSDYIVSPMGPEQLQLPRAFLFLGQRFTPDSWAFSQTVFDSIQWREGGVTSKVWRRVPSAVDVAFAVLANDHVMPILAHRIGNTNAGQATLHAERYRDGLPYQHNLAAARAVVDAQEPAAWESNIYMNWLRTLRQLSHPTTASVYPEAMRTKAWAMKTLNTQLASWTQLRHDNVLYVKQSYTAGLACFYPSGFVEPRVEFWASMEAMANRAADLIAALTYEGEYTYAEVHAELRTNANWVGWVDVWSTNTVPLTVVQSNQAAHLRRFSTVAGTLRSLSQKQLAQERFNESDDAFIKDLIQLTGRLPLGSGGVRKYDGWYPRLFYRPLPYLGLSQGLLGPEVYFQETFGANAADRLVVDVHTDVSALEDPGGVLHQGIGTPNFMLVAVDNGPDRMIYAGPVLSYYEFEIVGEPYRMNDLEWEGVITTGQAPGVPVNRIEGLEPPSWTRSYLVPK